MKEWVMYIKLLLYMWNINIFFYVLYDIIEHKYSLEFKLQFILKSIAFIISITFYFIFVQDFFTRGL